MINWFNFERSDSKFVNMRNDKPAMISMIEKLARERKKLNYVLIVFTILMIGSLLIELFSETKNYFMILFCIVFGLYGAMRWELVDFKIKVLKLLEKSSD